MSTRFARIAPALFAGLLAFGLAQQAAADIYQWEWIDPADPSKGIRQSSTLCPGGKGVLAKPGTSLDHYDLTQAYLLQADLSWAHIYFVNLTNASLAGANLSWANIDDANLTDASLPGANLSRASFRSTNLTNASLAGANLTRAIFYSATLSNADFTDAQIAEAEFRFFAWNGFTPAQFYSTASYKARDLHDIRLSYNDLTAWNLANQNLTGARFWEATLTNASLPGASLAGTSFWKATLTNADFTDAQVAQAGFEDTTSRGFTSAQLYSTASYKARDLHNIQLPYNDLTAWNFANQNLTGASFQEATLTNADFTDAIVRSARFSSRQGTAGIASAQLYSTASYKARDLHGICLQSNDLTAWNFANQNLTSASFWEATLTDADFTSDYSRDTAVDCHRSWSMVQG